MNAVAERRPTRARALLAALAVLQLAMVVEGADFAAAPPDGETSGPPELVEVGLQASVSDPPVSPSPTEAKGPWIGPDGEVLAFRVGDEVTEFLRAANVVSVTDIPVGVTNPKKLLLERDGVQTHAIFRYEHVVKDQMRLRDGTFHVFFKDSYLGEPAAFELARLLGLNTVPPATVRSIRRLGAGSIQLWIENAMTEADRRTRNLQPPDLVHFSRQLQNMSVFDNLVNNIDRNQGNILIGPDWKIWYIDCTRCFARARDLPRPDRVRRIERRFWKRLQALDWDEARRRLTRTRYITSFEFRALTERHAKLVAVIEQRIRELGEDAVLFSFEEDRTLETPEIPELPPDSSDTIDASPSRSGSRSVAPPVTTSMR